MYRSTSALNGRITICKRSVEAIAKEFVERYAKKRNRSWQETQRILNHDVIPAWGKRPISDIRRADVNELLDAIEDRAGAPMATAVLAQIRKMFAWHATRVDAPATFGGAQWVLDPGDAAQLGIGDRFGLEGPHPTARLIRV